MLMENKKHNLNEAYLNSLTEEELDAEMDEWTSEDWANYHCPNGTMTPDEFVELGISLISKKFEELGWT
ncbi:MAG: hypothetical protein MJZ20_13725 [Bacteroidaceae bacterium]|nr:hypothetical protein [Bacteroidaceae bacterium]